MAASSQYIGRLIEKSFDTFSSILGLHEDVQELFGCARRILDVLLVLDGIDHGRARWTPCGWRGQSRS